MKAFLATASLWGGFSTASSTPQKSLSYGSSNAQILLQAVASEGSTSHSPPHYPSPWMDPQASGWEEAYAKAKAFVSQMTLIEKVNLTSGTG